MVPRVRHNPEHHEPGFANLSSPEKSQRQIKRASVVLFAASILLTFIVLSNLTFRQNYLTSLVTTAPPSKLAISQKRNWITGEDVTFILQEDMNATFFFVEDDPTRGIDPIRNFLLGKEKVVRSLFHHLLFLPGCVEREQEKPYGTSCPKMSDTHQNVVLDVGSNRGWYSLMSAAYGHTVYSFDPQPHCKTLLTASIIMNGFDDLITFIHAFVTDITQFSLPVKRRTGCMGGFPNNNHEGYADRFRKPLDRLPGANETVTVGSVRLDDLFDPKTHMILLMKMDVEGHELHALASAKRLLKARAIQNIVMELNMPMMSRQKEGKDEMKRKMLALITELITEHGFKSKSSGRGHWSAQKPMTLEEWRGLFTVERDAFFTLDVWFYL